MNRTHYPFLMAATAMILINACVSPSTHKTVLADRDRLRTEHLSLEQKNQKLEEQLSGMSGASARSTERIRDLERRVDQQAGDLELLSGRNLQLAEDLDQMNRRNRDLLDRLDVVQLETDRFNETVAGLTEKLKDSERLMRQAEALDLAAKELSRELEHYRSSALREEKEQKDRRAALENLRGNLTRLFEKETADGEITLVPENDVLTIRLAESLIFQNGALALSPGGIGILNRLAEALKDPAAYRVEVEGHTDSVPVGPQITERFATHWELSAARAGLVVRHFQDNGLLDRTRLVMIGRADTLPIADNETPEGRKVNRRIEIRLIPLRTGKPPSEEASTNESEVGP